MALIDSHVNLHAQAFAEDLDAVLTRARAAGVTRMVTICDRLANLETVKALARAHPGIVASVGAHPHHAKDRPDLTSDELVAFADDPIVAAIGETGLDRHYNHSPLAQQIDSFRAHIEAARRLDLPLIVHTRAADDVTAQVLEEARAKGALRILMHCYTSGAALARRALAIGAYFSFSGIMTFKNAHDVRAVAREIPLDRVILETDCPYLAPVPHRGQRCEPAMVADVYKAFFTLRDLEAARGEALIAENFHRLFRSVAAP